MNKISTIGLTNTTTNAISKGVTFIGAILMFTGMGGIILSNKQFTETEMKYLADTIKVTAK